MSRTLVELGSTGIKVAYATELALEGVFLTLSFVMLRRPASIKKSSSVTSAFLATIGVGKSLQMRDWQTVSAAQPTISVSLDEIIARTILWQRLRIWMIRLPLLAGLGCLAMIVVIVLIFGHPSGSMDSQLRVKVGFLAAGYVWAVIAWALPALFGEMTPRYLIAARILAILRLTARDLFAWK